MPRTKPISHEQTQESLTMLKLLSQSQRSVEAGRHKLIRKGKRGQVCN